MTQALAYVNLTEETAPPGLVPVHEIPSSGLALDEQIAVRQAFKLSPKIDYVFFRRFADGRSSHVAAYVIDNADGRLSEQDLGHLHHKLWLSGATPLLYVGWRDHVDILTCAAGESSRKVQPGQIEWKYDPVERIETVSDISDALEKAKRYSAFRLIDGTFWEDRSNIRLVNPNRAAHRFLIEKVKQADKNLNGKENKLARRLLLLTIFVKYLEDRKVFDYGKQEEASWFSQYCNGATSFLKVLESGSVSAVRLMFKDLQEKFNGDIFVFDEDCSLDSKILSKLVNLVHPASDAKGQIYFWDVYSFEHIPVEVLSHIYQHFAESNKGAVFTPPLLVDLMLDQAMPLDQLRGTETVFDPTCGSGIFLVAAFKRLVHVWAAKQNWHRLTPPDLKSLLLKTIFGVEDQSEAVEVTAFSLALAICDALLPEIIWRELRFEKIVNRNIFVGDFAEHAADAKRFGTNNEGFDIIVGNPPFLSKLTPAMQGVLKEQGKKPDDVPDKQAAYLIVKECIKSHLKSDGRLCMVQPAGFLYNEKPQKFRQELFAKYQFDAILDFVSFRGLFEGADTKIIALLIRNRKPLDNHEIAHLTFRRTNSANGLIQFELDYYDHNHVSQSDAVAYYWPWRINLLGGGRLYHLGKRLNSLKKIKDVVLDNGWSIGEGYIAGQKGVGKPAKWLSGRRLLPTEAFTSRGIDHNKLSFVNDDPDDLFEGRRTEERFTSPLLLIKEHLSLPTAFWDDGPLAYKAQIVGIYGGKSEDLRAFYNKLQANNKMLQASCFLLGTRMLVSKATSPNKGDIERLPSPPDEGWGLVPWENELLDDVCKYMADYVRLGQDSKLLQHPATKIDLERYRATFLRLTQKMFPSIHPCGEGRADGLIFQAFCFQGENTIGWLGGRWLQHLRSTVFKNNGDASSLCTVRLVRMYEDNTLILVKPDRLRYWIRSTAIRDFDNTLMDIMQSEASDA